MIKTDREIEEILGLTKSKNTLLLEIWHDKFDYVLEETGDFQKAINIADQSVCNHPKTKIEYSSDFFSDPPGIEYRANAWRVCKICNKVLNSWNTDEDRGEYY